MKPLLTRLDDVINLNEIRLQCQCLLDEEVEDDGAFVIGLIMLMVRIGLARKRRRRQRRRRILLGKFVIQDAPFVMQPTVMAPVTFKQKSHNVTHSRKHYITLKFEYSR